MEAKAQLTNEPLKAKATLSSGTAGGVSGEYYTKAEVTDLLTSKGDKAQVDTNTADIATAKADITALKNKETKIATGDKVLSIDGTGTLSSSVSLALEQDKIVLKGTGGVEISSIQANLINKAAIDSAATTASTANNKADTNAAEITTLKASVTANTGKITTFEAAIKKNADDIEVLKGEVSANFLQLDLSEYEGEVGDIAQHIGETTETLVFGYVYKMIEDTEVTPQAEGDPAVEIIKKWQRIDVQPAGSTITLDDSVTETSSNGVKSSGIYTAIHEAVPTKLSDLTDDLAKDSAPTAESGNYITSGAVAEALEDKADKETWSTDYKSSLDTAITDISAVKDYLTTEKESAIDSAISASHSQNTDTSLSGIVSVEPSVYRTTMGRYGEEDTTNTKALVIGNGTSTTDRSNAMSVSWDGEVTASEVTANGKKLSESVSNLNGIGGIKKVSDISEVTESNVLYVIFDADEETEDTTAEVVE